MMQLGAESVFVGSGIYKSEDPPARAKAIVAAVTYYDDPEKLAEVSYGLEAAMKGLEGKYVYGLGNLFDHHPDVAEAFAKYIETADVGLNSLLEEHYAVSRKGRLHKLIDRATWNYAAEPEPSGAVGPVAAVEPAAADTNSWPVWFQ